MAMGILQAKTEMEPQTEDLIKAEHMDYILGISTSEDSPSDSNHAIQNPLKPDITEDSSMVEHVSIKVEPVDTTCTDLSDMNICDNYNIGAHLQPVIFLKSQEFLKSSWEDFKKFLKKKIKPIRGVVSNNCVIIDDGLSISDHDIINYLEFHLRSNNRHKSGSKDFEELKSTLSEAYALYRGRDFASDFPQAWKHISVQEQSVLGYQKNQIQVRRCRERIWMRLCQMTKKECDFTDSDMISFIKFELKTKKWKHTTFDKYVFHLRRLYREKLSKNFEEDFPEAWQFVAEYVKKPRYNVANSKHKGFVPVTKRHKNYQIRYHQNMWKKLCEMTKKEVGFTDSEMTSFFRIEFEKNKWKPSTLDAHRSAFRKLFREKHGKNFDNDFPETCLFITESMKKIAISSKENENIANLSQNSDCINETYNGLKSETNAENENSGRINLRYRKQSSERIVPKNVLKRSIYQRTYHEKFWKKLCQMTKKEVEFTDSEMTSFFRIESAKNNWKPASLAELRYAFGKLYQEKHGRKFDNDFPEACQFVLEYSKKHRSKCKEFDTKENEDTNNLPQDKDCMNETYVSNYLNDSEENMRRQEVWQEFCNFTKKSEDFNEKHIIGFMQSESAKPQRMTNWLYPLAEAYTLKFKKDFWLQFPNVFTTILTKE